MNRLTLLILILLPLLGCTDQQMSRGLGGTTRTPIPCGRRVFDITWKEGDLWLATEELGDHKPRTIEYIQRTPFRYLEGTVIIEEHRCPKK